MLRPEHIIPMLLEADPGFHPVWLRYLDQWEGWESLDDHEDEDLGNPRGYYNDAIEFAHYLWRCLSEQRTERFPAIFEVFERIVTDPHDDQDEDSSYPYNLIHIGIFENLQHEILKLQALDTTTPTAWDRDVFWPWLGPVSALSWIQAGMHTGLHNHAIWEEHMPAVLDQVDGQAIEAEELKLLATDCRLRSRGLQGRALVRLVDGKHILWFVDATRQAVVALDHLEARHAFARMEHPVIRSEIAFPGSTVYANGDVPASSVTNPTNRNEQLLAIVRGEQHWSKLNNLLGSIRVQQTSLGWYATLVEPAAGPVPIDSTDVLTGFRAYLSDPIALQQWSFLVWASDLWMLQRGTSFDQHDQYKDARVGTWDAAFEESLKPALIRRIATLDD